MAKADASARAAARHAAAPGTEVELKFRLDPARRAAVERVLGTRTAERVRLRARYFDTPDGRLAAARLALRLRLEGERWVQTLKGQGDGVLRRLEDDVPLPGAAGELPPPLDPARHDGTAAGRALQQALAGAAPPRLVYGTEIERLRRVLRHGGARIEVALDVGALVAGDARAPVCELEFELVDGPPQALLDLAARWADRFGLVLDVTTKAERGQRLAAGSAAAPVVRASEPVLDAALPLAAARAVMVGSALAHALPNAAAVVGGAHGPEHVHQLRVALRRLRTVLRAFGPRDEARDEAVGALFAALGGTRDADVMAQTLAPAWAAAAAERLVLPPADSPPGADGAAAALADPATTRLWLQLLALAQPPDTAEDDEARPWAEAAVATALRWRKRSRKRSRGWAQLEDAARHKLRKQLKRLRYLLDFSAPLWPSKALAAELGALRPLQEALGHWNDLVVARAHLAMRIAVAQAAQADPLAAAQRPAIAATPAQPDVQTPPTESDPGLAALHFARGWLAREALAADSACVRAATRWRRLPALVAKATRATRAGRRRRPAAPGPAP